MRPVSTPTITPQTDPSTNPATTRAQLASRSAVKSPERTQSAIAWATTVGGGKSTALTICARATSSHASTNSGNEATETAM